MSGKALSITNMRACNKFGERSSIYAFTTENLGGYLPRLPIAGRKILAICGSCDHAINCYFHGASSVTVFDVNEYALYWAELKMAALRNLEFTDYIDMFMLDSGDKSLAYDTYLKLRAQLSASSQRHWDQRYIEFCFQGRQLRQSACFNNKHDMRDNKIIYNEYLHSEIHFRKTQDIMRHSRPVMLQSNILELPDRLCQEKYDLILLSNIADYLESIFSESDDLLEEYKKWLAKAGQSLNPHGIIAAAYIYDYRKHPQEVHGVIDNPELRKKYLGTIQNTHYEEYVFFGVATDTQDALCTLQYV